MLLIQKKTFWVFFMDFFSSYRTLGWRIILPLFGKKTFSSFVKTSIHVSRGTFGWLSEFSRQKTIISLSISDIERLFFVFLPKSWQLVLGNCLLRIQRNILRNLFREKNLVPFTYWATDFQIFDKIASTGFLKLYFCILCVQGNLLGKFCFWEKKWLLINIGPWKENIDLSFRFFRRMFRNYILRFHGTNLRKNVFSEKLRFFNQSFSDNERKSFEFLARLLWQCCQNCILRVQSNDSRKTVFSGKNRFFEFPKMDELLVAFSCNFLLGILKTVC